MTKPLVLVVTPVFNDWESFAMLARELSELAQREDIAVRVIAVDDGSHQQSPAHIDAAGSLAGVEIVKLVCNLGHQRAIAIGLVEASKVAGAAGIVVMDCDGEDRVADIPALLAEARESAGAIVVASRASRSEGIKFRAFYSLYRTVFRLLSGVKIDFGNFCYIPASLVSALTHNAGVWNHLAASLCRSRLPLKRRPCPRGNRYAGQSQMNFSSLLLHGLGAMSVYIDIVLVRMFTVIAGFTVVLVAGILVVLFNKFVAGYAVPGWATSAIGVLMIMLLQSFIVVLTSVFSLLNLRTMRSTIPATDAVQYVESRWDVELR